MEKITLRAARKKTGLTIEKAAEKIGVTRETLSRWERGVTVPNVIQFKTVEKVLNIKYEDMTFSKQ